MAHSSDNNRYQWLLAAAFRGAATRSSTGGDVVMFLWLALAW